MIDGLNGKTMLPTTKQGLYVGRKTLVKKGKGLD
jgi:hypothetical protein